jgi:TIR domain-containing protein
MGVGGIFISYRREDTQGEASHVFENLGRHFGIDRVFMDVTSLAYGRDFRTEIESAVSACDVLIAMIGKNWLGVTDGSGKRRLDNANDFVGLETRVALRRNIPVIPVLVQGATMPRPEQLPGDLEMLAWRHAFELRHNRWDVDVAELVRALEQIVPPNPLGPTPAPKPPMRSGPSDDEAKDDSSLQSRRYALISVLVTGGVAIGGLLIYTLVENIELREVECGSKFFPNAPYKIWHKGPESDSGAQTGQMEITDISTCPEGTCFKGKVTFLQYSSTPDDVAGYWNSSRIVFARHMGLRRSQDWEGTCRSKFVDGRWHFTDTKYDYGPFKIHY